jgi:hypothetical protein
MDKSELINKILSKWSLKSKTGIIDVNDLSTFKSVLKECNIPENLQTELYQSFLKVNTDEIVEQEINQTNSTIDKLIQFLNKYTKWEEEVAKIDNAEFKETWPLYTAFGDSGAEYVNSQYVNLIKQWFVLDNEFKSFKAVIEDKKIIKILGKINYEVLLEFIKKQKFVMVTTGESTNETLKNIQGFPNASLSGFIHKSIKQIQDILKEMNKSGGKIPTFDAVLLYGSVNLSILLNSIKNNQYKVSDTDDSLIDVLDANGKPTGHFALISLKSGASGGRVGGIKTKWDALFSNPQPNPQPVNESLEVLDEGIVSHIASSINDFYSKVSSGTSSVFNKIKNSWDKFKNSVTSFAGKIENIFRNGDKIFKEVDAKYPELTELANFINAEKEAAGDLTEKSGECGSAYIEDKAKGGRTKGPFRNSYEIYKNSAQKDIIKAKNTYDELMRKKSILEKAGINIDLIEIEDFSNLSSTYIKEINETWEEIKDKECILRESVNFITGFESNIKSIEQVNIFISKISSELSNTSEIRKNYLDIAKQLASEAIYGSNDNLPLIKMEKGKIKKLGTKKNYEDNTFVKDINPDLKLGLLSVQPPQKGEGRYLVIVFYIFFGIEDIDDVPSPVYARMELRRDSQSKFLTKQEFNKPISGKDLFK